MTTDDFCKAVGQYIKANGGNAVVVGGVAVETQSGKFNYRLIVDFMGRPPTAVETENRHNEKPS